MLPMAAAAAAAAASCTLPASKQSSQQLRQCASCHGAAPLSTHTPPPHGVRHQNKLNKLGGRRRGGTIMSAAPLEREAAPPLSSPPLELLSASDFASVADASGRVQILGFGSLLSERSARSTFPLLLNFSPALLLGFRRVFCHSAPIFFARGIARPETKEVSSLSVEPWEGTQIVVSVFDIPLEEVPAFIEREHEFRFLAVTAAALDGKPLQQKAVVCSRYSDEEYRTVRLRGDESEYERRYGQWGILRIWDDSVLPCRVYLRHCVLAAKNLGDLAYESFLDGTYLADRETTIRSYLTANPNIMDEMPPESLSERYGG